MHWSLLIATSLVLVASAAPDNPRIDLRDFRTKRQSSDNIEKEWHTFQINKHKMYGSPSEEIFRKKVFMKNLNSVEAHNRLYSQGLTTFKMATNRFSDLEYSEFVKLMTGYTPERKSDDFRPAFVFDLELNDSSTLPDEIDWRLKGYVTPVKNQKRCGSCWAFSATGTLEGQHFRKTGQLVKLSEQQLVDCSKRGGCCGGVPSLALQYIASNGGINAEASYPYEAAMRWCSYNPDNISAICKDYVEVMNSESALQAAVATVGPISVAIAVTQSFMNYESGVFDDRECINKTLSHTVLVVGYGTTPEGLQYWIVKNSWGTEWGNDGYIWMSRNNANQCGIADHAVYPEV